MSNPFQFLLNRQKPGLHLADLAKNSKRALTLDERLELAFKAVEHAKERCPRSDNQRYFKTFNPAAEQKRAHFLVNLARCEPTDPFRMEIERKVKGIVADPGLTRDQRNEQIDRLIHGLKDIDAGNGGNGVNLFSAGQDRMAKLKADLAWDKRLAVLLKQPEPDEPSEKVSHMAQWAEDAGAGNCGEKSALAVEYLRKHAPAGHHVAWVCYDPNYKEGDHAFCVFGTDNQLVNGGQTNIGQWGSEAVIIDGWMNDAYPANHPFAWKYGYNYKGVRINPKQLAVRTRLCVTFRDHLKVMGAWTT